jgi:predicted secreted hydrolase
MCLRRVPDEARGGWGFPSAGAQSVGQGGGLRAGGETTPPRLGAPAAHFSGLTLRAGRIAPRVRRDSAAVTLKTSLPAPKGPTPKGPTPKYTELHLILALSLTVATAFAQSPAWKSAEPGRAIVLPADHASHPDYKIEWWYYTGNLDAAGGLRFGYQLTFFRIGVDPAPLNPSRWAVRDLYMTHLALTDVNGQRFQFTERMNRAGPGWAGADVGAYRVWNEDWEAAIDATRTHRLRASGGRYGIDLQLEEGRAPALHGDRGYSRKGSASGNATHYYSLTRMPTRGALTLDGRRIEVAGLSWMDHEFGTSALEPEQLGWDWFSIQLEDGRDLMIFRLRRADGSIDPRSSGTLVEPDGSTRSITLESGFNLEPGRTWTSPTSRARYPIVWTVRVPGSALDLSVTAAVENQELHTEQSTGVTYWEGAIDVAGTSRGRPVRGRGYLEMTGYAGKSMGNVMR